MRGKKKEKKRPQFSFWCFCRFSFLRPAHWDSGKERLFSFWYEGFSCNRSIFLAGHFKCLFVGLMFKHPHFMCIWDCRTPCIWELFIEYKTSFYSLFHICCGFSVQTWKCNVDILGSISSLVGWLKPCFAPTTILKVFS